MLPTPGAPLSSPGESLHHTAVHFALCIHMGIDSVTLGGPLYSPGDILHQSAVNFTLCPCH